VEGGALGGGAVAAAAVVAEDVEAVVVAGTAEIAETEATAAGNHAKHVTRLRA